MKNNPLVRTQFSFLAGFESMSPSDALPLLLLLLAAVSPSCLPQAEAKTPIPWHRKDPDMRKWQTKTQCIHSN